MVMSARIAATCCVISISSGRRLTIESLKHGTQLSSYRAVGYGAGNGVGSEMATRPVTKGLSDKTGVLTTQQTHPTITTTNKNTIAQLLPFARIPSGTSQRTLNSRYHMSLSSRSARVAHLANKSRNRHMPNETRVDRVIA